MSDRPQEGREERRRTGPLGDEDDETRQVPTENDPEATRRVRSGEDASSETRREAQEPSQEENETRVIRVPDHPDTTRDATPYPRGYFEAAEEREDRLRDMYGGVDWLASFLGFIFAIVLGALFSAVAGLVLVPFGITARRFGRADRGLGHNRPRPAWGFDLPDFLLRRVRRRASRAFRRGAQRGHGGGLDVYRRS